MLTGKVKYQEESIKTLDNLRSYKQLIFLTSAQNTPSHPPKKNHKKNTTLWLFGTKKKRKKGKRRDGGGMGRDGGEEKEGERQIEREKLMRWNKM